MSTPAELYTKLVATLANSPEVTHVSQTGEPARGFGADALKTRGKIFAMLSKDRLVVKLPRERVQSLVAAGVGDRFDPGRGRMMKEWLSISPACTSEWFPLAREALAFVGSR